MNVSVEVGGSQELQSGVRLQLQEVFLCEKVLQYNCSNRLTVMVH